jgi:heme/copper-type cytochrome/quinol oxidase subunit 1
MDMFLLEWTASDLLMILLAATAMIGLVFWLVPGARAPHRSSYSRDEITSYDHEVPRYFLAAAIALGIGGLHTVIKNLPGFWTWLWQAGYGGHLFRDLSNSHIIIVGGGTVLLTGLTWYLLPRVVNRPLYSNSLATASFWFTVIGVFGFYLAWLVLGLVEGNMVRHGIDYTVAKDILGSAHRVPTRMTASIMGLGYWTYVLNVFLTLYVGRHVKVKPLGHLQKFIAVSAAALFVGTVQGVIQVLPANADWIHAAGKFGEFVDPISHAHINLVTGMMVSLAALLAYFSPRMGGGVVSKRAANRMFWTLVPGSMAFYLTFLMLGLVLGNAANGYGGIHSLALATFLGGHMQLLQAASGALMWVGFWVYFITLWRTLSFRSLREQARQAMPAVFWLVSSLLLVVGTFQGLLQAIPASSRLLTAAEEIPNVHAQLNMIGGVLLALIGVVYLLLPELVGEAADRRLVRRSLLTIGGGISAYYLATLTTGLLRYQLLIRGLDDGQAASGLGIIPPLALTLTALPLLAGFLTFGVAIYRVTRAYRRDMATEMRVAPARFSGPMPERLKRIPSRFVLGMEFVGGLLGWPGLGWLYAGQAMPAIGLLLVGPAVAWALLPMLFSPFTNTALSQWNWHVLLVWLPGSALLSSGLLWGYLSRRRRSSMIQKETLAQVPPVETLSRPPTESSNRRGRRVPRGFLLGAGAVLLALLSVPVIPLITGIPSAGDVQQPLMSQLPDRANGAYLEAGDGTQSGLVKLFAWAFPLDELPQESPAIHPSHFQGFIVQQKGLDDPEHYRLYHLQDGDSVPLSSTVTSFQTQLRLVPTEPLEEGDYMLDIPSGGMFAGREYYYFRIDPKATLPTLISASTLALPPADVGRSQAASPTNGLLLELLPLSASLLSGLAAGTMVNRLRHKVRPHEAAWALAFGMFSLAAAAQVFGDLAGWTPLLVRIYYVLGATLVVGWLALGTWLVIVRATWARKAAVWSLLLLSGYAVGVIGSSPVDGARLSLDGWHALQKPIALTVLTIGINSAGTIVLVGGALWTAWIFWRKRIQHHKMVGLLLLALGTLVVAAGGGLTRLGHDQYLYTAMSLGVGLMYWGYLQTIRPKNEQPARSARTAGMVVEGEARAGVTN